MWPAVKMEQLLKWLDDLDDVFAVTRLQIGPLAATLALLMLFVAAVGVVFLIAPPDPSAIR